MRTSEGLKSNYAEMWRLLNNPSSSLYKYHVQILTTLGGGLQTVLASNTNRIAFYCLADIAFSLQPEACRNTSITHQVSSAVLTPFNVQDFGPLIQQEWQARAFMVGEVMIMEVEIAK